MATHIKFEPYHGKSDSVSLSPVPTTETDLIEIGSSFLKNATQLGIFVDFTLGSLTQAVLKVYFSPDNGNNWYQVKGIDEDLTLLGNTKMVYALPIYPADKMKITIQGTGTNTGSQVSLKVMNKSN
jgi:hypothetical protein